MKAVIIQHEEFIDAFTRPKWTGKKDVRNLHECRNHNGEIQMKYLAVLLSSMMLVACGGGGGSVSSDASSSSAAASSGVSPASVYLSQYEGVWRQDCVAHMRLTRTNTATGSDTFSVTTKQEYFDNADCTGALVATGGFGQPDETVRFTATLTDATVQLTPSETIVAAVDPATSVLAVAPFTFTGSGVVSTSSALGTTFARIEYANGDFVVAQGLALTGQTTKGALMIRNGELLALVPIGTSTTSFQVNRRYIR
ncbi:MAG: hypothetical protein Q7T10_12220 [Rhodoferax sp.]|uniref:hypothetical protein n=1 Tax=Rhodoferax sp. TaxID=50421 RepID=UPI0027277A3C|nr:hypothetical protein [Rhodoferax sp.]MDO8449558.1 hypothetical protein [Rhodoferax sp.]